MYVKNYFLIIVSLNIIKKKKKQLLKYMQAQNNNLELPLIFQSTFQPLDSPITTFMCTILFG